VRRSGNLNREELEERLAEIEAEQLEAQQSRDDAQAEIDLFEGEPNEEVERQYDEALDAGYELPFDWSCSRVMQEMDPTMYRCGLNDYHDSVVKDKGCGLDDLYVNLEEQEDILRVLSDEQEDLQAELEYLDEEE